MQLKAALPSNMCLLPNAYKTAYKTKMSIGNQIILSH